MIEWSASITGGNVGTTTCVTDGCSVRSCSSNKPRFLQCAPSLRVVEPCVIPAELEQKDVRRIAPHSRLEALHLLAA